jgi:hypothetical protein
MDLNSPERITELNCSYIMTKNTGYPTWQKTPDGWISEEQRDDVPDFKIIRQAAKCWLLKWRTSACWEKFFSAAEAKKSVEAALRYQDGMKRRSPSRRSTV